MHGYGLLRRPRAGGSARSHPTLASAPTRRRGAAERSDQLFERDRAIKEAHSQQKHLDRQARIRAPTQAPLALQVGRRALAFAGDEGHWTVVRVLLDAGADPGPPGLLHHAARWGNLRLVRELLEGGVDLQSEGGCGNALTELARDPRGRPADVEATALFLMAAGIDANVPCRGKRPVRWAHERGDTEMASRLEEAGASDGTTLGFKLRRLGKTIQSAGLVVALLLGGGM